MTKTLRQTCTCKHCGNEAEMEITCTLSDYEEALEKKQEQPSGEAPRVKGTGVCTSCGSEADMWIDI